MKDDQPSEKELEELLKVARNAALNAHAPYSSFRVGAAVFAGSKTYTGCNVENASYGLSMCAERTAIFNAIADGAKSITALAVSCVDSSEQDSIATKMPCGACRQVMSEFATKDFVVVIDGVGLRRMEELLPLAFSLDR